MSPDVAERYNKLLNNTRLGMKEASKRGMVKIGIGVVIVIFAASILTPTGTIIALAWYIIHGIVVVRQMWLEMNDVQTNAMRELDEVERYWDSIDSFR